MRFIRSASFGLLVLLASAYPCIAQESPDPSPTALVERFIAAFNAHEISSMLALVSPDVQWLSVDGDSVTVQTNSEEELANGLGSYFESVPSSRSTIEAIMEAGRFVSVWERAHWDRDGEPASQSSLAVYETEAGLITRIWYYPVMK